MSEATMSQSKSRIRVIQAPSQLYLAKKVRTSIHIRIIRLFV
jgi:hypothetical protein